MAIQPSNERSSEQEQGNRIHEIRKGRVIARIYRNVSLKEGTYYRIAFLRSEFDAEKKWTAKSFFPEDMKNIASAARSSHFWLRDNTDFVLPSVMPMVATFNRDESSENPTAHEVQVGNVLASVWENTSRAGKVYHKVSFRRGEQNGGEMWFFNSVRPEDLSQVAHAAINCQLWFQSKRAVREDVGPDLSEEKRPAKRTLRRASK